MPQTCTICRHEQRGEIDEALVARQSFRHIAARYGTSTGALQRHNAHLPANLAKAHAAKEAAQADSLLGQLLEINRETRAILREARESPKGQGVALLAITRVEKQIELQAKLLGELKDGPQVSVHIDQQWILIEKCILDALAPFPEARIAVADALKKVNDGN
jgi:hypothetical protein